MNEDLLYNLTDRPPMSVFVLSALQWFFFTMANTITVPIVLGSAFGFTPGELMTFTCNTFFVTGLVSMLQVLFGHRLPVLEGPAGMWWGVFIILIQMSREEGLSLLQLRQELEFALIAAGILNMCIASFGVLKRLERLFTPAVTGTFLILLALQLSKSLVSGMMGLTSVNGSVRPIVYVMSIALICFTVLLMTKGKGLIRSLSVLISLVIGWAMYLILGLDRLHIRHVASLIHMPTPLPWGAPLLHSGILTTALITSTILLSNLIASVKAMESILPNRTPANTLKRATLISGVGNALSGAFGVVGLVPLTVAASLVSLTKNAARIPFIIASGLVIMISVIPWLGYLFSSIPVPVGYAVLFTVFAQLLGFGLQDIRKLQLNQRDLFVVGIPILLGAGTNFIAGGAWTWVTPVLGYLLDNGLIVGVICVILLEHVVFRKTT